MADSTTPPETSPSRSTAIPESYAVYVTDARISVWQYRVDVADPDGKWHFVETLKREDNPKLSLDYATLRPPAPDGYWIYSKSYSCELDCASESK
jgi:hypothetical protein